MFIRHNWQSCFLWILAAFLQQLSTDAVKYDAVSRSKTNVVNECMVFCIWQNNTDELRAERLRRATERLRSPVVFNKDSAVRKTQLKSFSQYVESRPGERQHSKYVDVLYLPKEHMPDIYVHITYPELWLTHSSHSGAAESSKTTEIHVN